MREPQAAKLIIMTVGHSTRRWSDFLKTLRAHSIRRVVDIRTIPHSRHNPQFDHKILSRKLRNARIGYVHLGDLGGLRRVRHNSQNMGWRNNSFRGFADYMQTAKFEEGINRLMKLAAERKTAIMCAEAVPWRCHRSLVGDALTIRGVRVEDIMSENRCRVHSLTTFARVSETCITYPQEETVNGYTKGNDKH